MSALAISSLDQLKLVLLTHNIEYLQYGQGTAKSLSQLLKEIQEGECSLSVVDGQLIRTVSVLAVAITRSDGRVLTEVNQTFHKTSQRDEYSRQRNVLLLEKMLPNETAAEATRRGINEELGLDVSHLVVTWDIIKRTSEQKYSQSYPDLLCSYDRTTVTIPLELLGVEIEDGYTFTEFLQTGEPRVTATWKWL
ncbi:Hypothetical protein POVR2_LOCUS45 [uncultured virus]|nr:Hypothetical protein POVR2_LOCUS45 [uncultured virus]